MDGGTVEYDQIGKPVDGMPPDIAHQLLLIYIVIVEAAPDMESAEKEADDFLDAESAADEAGCCYVRAKASGIKRGADYYFKVVAVADPR